MAGSSKQGKAFLASVGANIVVASHLVTVKKYTNKISFYVARLFEVSEIAGQMD